jgi:hypothetical protein
MLRDETRGSPRGLLVAPAAIEAESALVRIGMAAAAAAVHVGHHRTTVVVAAEAGGTRMRALEPVAGGLLVVEREVGSEFVPSLGDVTDPAIAAREGLVRHEGTPGFAPAVRRDDQFAVDGDEAKGAEDHRGRGQSEVAASFSGT